MLFIRSIFLVFLLWASAALAAQLSIPKINAVTDKPNYTEYVSEFGDCSRLLSEKSEEFPLSEGEIWKQGNTGLVRKIIHFANGLFERRSWSKEFLKGRLKLALNFRSRSRYAAVRIGDSKRPRPRDRIVGTIGVTYARYGRKRREELPMEEALGIELPRPGSEGILFELRTYAKDKKRGAHVFPQLLAGALKLVFFELQRYPELYNAPILYLYGDDLSVRFYRQLGFKVLDPEPVEYEGTKWWTLVSTPKELEALVNSLDGERYLDNLNQTLALELPNGRPVVAAPKTEIWFENAGDLSHVVLNEETEVLPGVFAAAKDEVEIHYVLDSQDWEIRLKLSRPFYAAKLGFEIPAGTWIEIYSSGDVANVWRIKEPIPIPALGVTAVQNIEIKYWETANRKFPRLISVWNFDKQNDLLPNLTASRRAEVTWVKKGRNQAWRLFSVDGVARPVKTSDGGTVPKNGWVYVLDNGALVSKDNLYPLFEQKALRRFVYRSHM